MTSRRWILLPAFCLALALEAGGSEARAAQQDDNLYARALAASVEKIINEWGELDLSDSWHARTDWKNIVVQSFPDITATMPRLVGDTHVEYLDDQGLIDRFKRVRKAFQIFQIHPMIVEGARVKVRFSLPWFQYGGRRWIPFLYDRRSLLFGYSDWSVVYFRLDQETRRYVVDEVRIGGI